MPATPGQIPMAADGEEVRGHACGPVVRPPPMEAGLVAGWKSPHRGSLGPPLSMAMAKSPLMVRCRSPLVAR